MGRAPLVRWTGADALFHGGRRSWRCPEYAPVALCHGGRATFLDGRRDARLISRPAALPPEIVVAACLLAPMGPYGAPGPGVVAGIDAQTLLATRITVTARSAAGRPGSAGCAIWPRPRVTSR
jgi:hypothetical protein